MTEDGDTREKCVSSFVFSQATRIANFRYGISRKKNQKIKFICYLLRITYGIILKKVTKDLFIIRGRREQWGTC